MKAWMLSVGALMYAATSVNGHGVLVEPPVRVGMGKTAGNPSGRKLVGEKVFRNLPANPANALSGCGSAASTGNPGKGTPKVTWVAGSTVKVCWENTIPHPEVAGTRSPGIRVSMAYTPAERFDQRVLLKDLDGGLKGMYCTTMKLPAGATCAGCVLQWSWVSIPDGGAYVGCADVRVVAAPPTCKASVWRGQVGNCAQGDGLFDLSPMAQAGAHPPGPAPINRACTAGATGANWAAITTAHNNLSPSLTTAKGDMQYGGRAIRRLGPGAGCPSGAKTPPKLAPAPGAPVTPKPVAPVVTTKPNGCPAGVMTASAGTTFMYPVTVPANMLYGQKLTIPCATANPGYVATIATHTGWDVRCSKTTGGFVLGPGGGKCGAYQKCSKIAANPAPWCGTAGYDASKANQPCTGGKCSVCCVGGVGVGVGGGGAPVVAPVAPTKPVCARCYDMSVFSASTGVCTPSIVKLRGQIIPNGECNQFTGAGTKQYYRLSCDDSGVSGSFACADKQCTLCATFDFKFKLTDVNKCIVKKTDCASPGNAATCVSSDMRFTPSSVCTAIDGANAWAVSTLGVAAAVTLANM